MPPVDDRFIKCYIYGMKPATPNDSEFIHDALDWFKADYCGNHVVVKIAHNPGAFAVVCSDRRGLNILSMSDRLLPVVADYIEIRAMEPEYLVEFLDDRFRDDEED